VLWPPFERTQKEHTPANLRDSIQLGVKDHDLNLITKRLKLGADDLSYGLTRCSTRAQDAGYVLQDEQARLEEADEPYELPKQRVTRIPRVLVRSPRVRETLTRRASYDEVRGPPDLSQDPFVAVTADVRFMYAQPVVMVGAEGLARPRVDLECVLDMTPRPGGAERKPTRAGEQIDDSGSCHRTGDGTAQAGQGLARPTVGHSRKTSSATMPSVNAMPGSG
jgi:hypothetical protein